MTFLEALEQASNRTTDNAKIERPRGPVFLVDHLGQMTMENNCLYLGDILGFDDWEVTETGNDETN